MFSEEFEPLPYIPDQVRSTCAMMALPAAQCACACVPCAPAWHDCVRFVARVLVERLALYAQFDVHTISCGECVSRTAYFVPVPHARCPCCAGQAPHLRAVLQRRAHQGPVPALPHEGVFGARGQSIKLP